MPAALIIEREDGSAEPLRLNPGTLEFGSVTALDGRRADVALAKLPPQPLGRHRIADERNPERTCELTVAPRRCFLPANLAAGRRIFGIAAQLYSLRRDGDQGIGDFTTLAQLAEMAAEAGAGTVGLNPLHALFPQDRERASPYYPSDRRFLDPVYIDVAALEGGRTRIALADHAGQIAALQALPDVDYAGVWALKRAVLEANFADFSELGAAPAREFEAFIARGGPSLHRFACFEAISELQRGERWPLWPGGLSACDAGALQTFASENAALVRFHLYLQWLADRQLGAAATRAAKDAARLGFYRDLAVGAAPDGAEVWADAGQFLAKASVGAPPDPFAEGGQNWALRAPNPLAWRADNFRLFREVIAANMALAGALRIDHAMGLTRLFVIPDGAKASDGAYLAFPERELIGNLALESQRARCLVVGEDLGTVPEHFRATMDAADILSYRVLWFERDAGGGFNPPAAYPAKSVACVTTHDLPTITGWWRREDIREKEALGLISPQEADSARGERAAARRGLLHALGLDLDAELDGQAGLEPGLIAAAHEFIRRTPSLIAMLQIDDLLGETTAVNLPGTNLERANWRRKLKGTLADIAECLAKRRHCEAQRAEAIQEQNLPVPAAPGSPRG
jgi:glycogen operon protein